MKLQVVNFIKKILQHIKSHKLSRDLGYSTISFFILAISGVLINIVISIVRTPADLGIFNLTYAIYIIASQFAVFGVHYSVLRFSAFYQHEKIELTQLFYSGTTIAFILGLCSFAVVFLGHSFFNIIFNSPAVSKSIQFCALGLIFFPLNKVLMSFLNGLQSIKFFSILQGLRYILVMLVVISVALSRLSIEYASLSFFVAESITTLCAILYVYRQALVNRPCLNISWVYKHLTFGSKSLLAGIFVELNTRVDVILIGFFLSNREVGIYSFAAMLIEGVYQILAMIRTNFNPILIGLIRTQDWQKAIGFRNKSTKMILLATVTLSILILTLYSIYCYVLFPEKGLQQGMISFLVLLAGLLLISPLVPFDNLMLVAGFPTLQTIQQLIIVLSNLIVSSLLLPHTGILGAALGTVFGNIAGMLFLNNVANKKLGWRLIYNSHNP